MGLECEASTHTGGWAVDGDLTGRCPGEPTGDGAARPLERHRTKRCQDEGRQTVVGVPGRAQAGQR